MFSFKKMLEMPAAGDALPGRSTPIPTARQHFVNGHPLKGPYPEGLAMAMFGLGCFWGAERKFWELGDGVYVTAVGYAGGHTPNPTYEEVCSGRTGHNEVVLVVYDPKKISYEQSAQDVLGKPRSDPGHAAGQRRRHAIPLRHLRVFAGATRRRRGLAGGLRQGARGRRHGRRSPPKSATPRRSISPRIITSNIWRRIRTAIAASAAPG